VDWRSDREAVRHAHGVRNRCGHRGGRGGAHRSPRYGPHAEAN